jgi:hypothetical protein
MGAEPSSETPAEGSKAEFEKKIEKMMVGKDGKLHRCKCGEKKEKEPIDLSNVTCPIENTCPKKKKVEEMEKEVERLEAHWKELLWGANNVYSSIPGYTAHAKVAFEEKTKEYDDLEYLDRLCDACRNANVFPRKIKTKLE